MAVDPRQHIHQGSLRRIINPENGQEPISTQPVLQCVQIKPLPGQAGAPDRFRVVFSDIDNYIQSMLATQANHVAQSGKLQKGCLVCLKSFQMNTVKGKRLIIVMDLEVLENLGIHEKVGEPLMLATKAEGDDVKPQGQPSTISSNGFYGEKPAAAQRPAPQARPQNPQSAAHANVYPIEALSPYAHKWTIKARVTNKSAIKTWHNKNGEGKLFSVNLLDESGEIKATGFNDQCEAFHDVFQEGSVYYITSPCRVQLAKKQFSNLNNDYELTFERDTQVEKAEATDDVPQIKFHFTSLADLQSTEKDAIVDTIGILKEVSETSEIVSKTTQKPYSKRELTLVDNTQYEVRLTIWGNSAAAFDVTPESVIAFKGVKVSDFGGRSLSLLSSGSMAVDPDIDEAHKLKGWYDAQGRNDTFATHASLGGGSTRNDKLKLVAQIKDENLGMNEAPDYFGVRATILYVKQDSATYPACSSEGCNKKVIEDESGSGWRCERCDKSHPRPQHRYIMTLNVADHTGQLYLNCFDDTGRRVMGMSADELIELKENDEKAYSEVFQQASCQTWVFNCRAKMDSYQDVQRVRYQVTGASSLNYANECAKLAGLIKLYNID